MPFQYFTDFVKLAARLLTRRGRRHFERGWDLVDHVGHHQDEHLRALQAYSGTKVVISCTGRRDILPVLTKATYLADLVILVPAPGHFSCTSDSADDYPEFCHVGMSGFEIDHDGRGASASGPFRVQLGKLFEEHGELFSQGAVTFLPILSASGHDWLHPDLSLPSLDSLVPSPSRPWTSESLHRFAMASLCKERSVAEKLGAFHLNDTSFTRPIVNDLRFCSDPSTSRLRRALLDFGLPVVEGLSLSDSLSVRKELRSEFARFTSTVFQLCHGSGAFQHSCASPISEVEEVLREESERFRRALSEVTQRSTTLRKRALVRTLVLLLASTGKLGTAASALLFHVGGGPVWDLIDAATEDAAHRLQVRKHSFLKAVQELHHMREGRSL